jgi:hypothetical protein
MARKNRKNYLPAFIINIIFWLVFGLVVFKVSPESETELSFWGLKLQACSGIILFFTFFTLALTFTLALILGNTRRGILGTALADGVLLLRRLGQASWLNCLLLAAVILSLELFFSQKSKRFR